MKYIFTRLQKSLAGNSNTCLVLALAFLAACNPSGEEDTISAKTEIPASFNYKATDNITVNLKAADKNGLTLTSTNIQIFDKDPNKGGKLLMEGATDNTGRIQLLKDLPTDKTELYIIGKYLGETVGLVVPIVNSQVIYTVALAVDDKDKEYKIANQQEDADADGIPDVNDKYPHDADRAFNNLTTGTLAFEDLWPYKGDFDVNDLVVNFTFNRVTNAQNKVVEIKSDFAIDAAGGSLLNGFAFQMPVAPGLVKNVTGSRLNHNYITLAANNLEAGQDKATVVVFDDVFDHIPNVSGFYNTQLNLPRSFTDTLHLTVSFVSPIDLSDLGDAPFNPFMIVHHNRGKEVHLPGMLPTAKANTALFGTADDNTRPAAGTFYKSKDNLPFALLIPERFDYPIEKASISDAYLKYMAWAQSGGKIHANWYAHDNNGFREQALIYNK